MKKILSRKLFFHLALCLSLVASFTFASKKGAAAIPVSDAFKAAGCAVNALLGDGQCVKEHVGRFVTDTSTALIISSSTIVGGPPVTPSSEIGALELARKNFPNNPYLYGGAIGAVGGTIGAIYTYPPNTFINQGDFYKQTLANNILGVGSAYAQVGGTEELKRAGIMRIWRVFRNLAYAFSVIIIVAFGVMVMLRYRTDPRTVVTAQMAIPRIAIALVLITFSFPLAGFIIDIGNVLTAFFFNLFSEGGPLAGEGLPITPGMEKIWQNFVFLSPGSLSIALGNLIMEFLFQLIVRIIALYVALKIFWMLISRYAMLFIQTIFAPLSFLWGALPGQEEHTARWFKGMLVNSLVFPATYIVVNIATLIRIHTDIFLPPAFSDRGDIAGLVGLGILSTAVKIPAILEDALDVTPSGHVARAGVEPGAVMRTIPFLGKIL